MAMALNGVRGFGRFRPSDPEVILPVHGQGIRLFIRRSGVDVNLVKIVGQAVRQVGQVPRVAEHLAIGM
jgi:hypothetical protein